jgi:hypothetical protein
MSLTGLRLDFVVESILFICNCSGCLWERNEHYKKEEEI